MAPKSNLTLNMKPTKKDEQVFEVDESPEDCDEDDESVGDYEHDSDDNNFLDAVTEASSRKRKLGSEDDDDDDDDDDMETENEQVVQKKKKKKKKSVTDMKPPTAEEMIRLRETQNLFHSNLFRMQIEEMLKEVKPRKVERKQIKNWLDKIKDFLLTVDDTDQIKLDPDSLPEDVKFPLPKIPDEEIKTATFFLKPISVSVVGSYNSGCCLGPSLSVDVIVEVPKKCFLKEDYLNARYHRKRAVYLGHLATFLRSSEMICQERGVSWVPLGGNPLCPRLLVYPSAEKLTQVKVYLSAVPQSSSFKLSRFTPCKNNVRDSWLTRGKKKDSQTASPIYNTSVLSDLVLSSNEAVRSQALESNNNLKDSVLLLRVWLRQRNLDLGFGGFSGYLVSMLVTAMMLSRKLNSLMSSYQIVRNVWLFLSQSDWTKEGYTMSSTKKEDTAPTLQEFHDHFDVVFVDATGYCNLAANVYRLTYMRIKQEAKLAVEFLDNPDMNSFQALFMTPMPFIRQFDHVLSIQKNWSVVKKILKKETTKSERVNYFATPDMLVAVAVCRLLERGVGERLSHLEVQLPPLPQWSVSEELPLGDLTLFIGLRLSPETAYSIVEKGPAANEPQAGEFRALWGERCELRRFRDGSVCEAVVWGDADSPLSTRRLVTRDMVIHLLRTRLELSSRDITYMADQLEPLVTEKKFIPESFSYGAGEEACATLVRVWDTLAKQLRELPDLPLYVTSVLGTAAALRTTDVFPPLPGNHKPPAKTVLESSECYLFSDTFTSTVMRAGFVLVVSVLLVGRGRGQYSGAEPHVPARDPPSNDIQLGTDTGLDKIQVVSSALRVTNQRDRYRGRRATPPVSTWRRPRQHQFVTREDRVSPPAIVRVYPPAPSQTASRRQGKRIIYYTTLPEIVRPSGWYDQRLDYYDARPSNLQQYRQPFSYNRYSGYQGYHNNDNEVTRVQSNIIDVTPPRSRFSSTPKFTIIDVEPPYNYNYNRYNVMNTPYPWRRPNPRPSYNDRPEPSLEPVKLQIPTSTSTNSTDTDNSTRLLPEIPSASIRSQSKFVT